MKLYIESGARSHGLLTGIGHREDNNLHEEDSQEGKGGDYNLNSYGSELRERYVSCNATAYKVRLAFCYSVSQR